MYTVVRTDIRPDVNVDFFRPVVTPEIQAIITATGLLSSYELSPDTLTRIGTYTWPSVVEFETYVTTPVILISIVDQRIIHDVTNNIISTVQSS